MFINQGQRTKPKSQKTKELSPNSTCKGGRNTVIEAANKPV